MPLYSFINTTTNEEYEEVMSYSEKDIFLESNPHIRQTYTKAPAIVRGTGIKTDSGFKEVLKKIKKGSDKECTINP